MLISTALLALFGSTPATAVELPPACDDSPVTDKVYEEAINEIRGAMGEIQWKAYVSEDRSGELALFPQIKFSIDSAREVEEPSEGIGLRSCSLAFHVKLLQMGEIVSEEHFIIAYDVQTQNDGFLVVITGASR
jgi:hypothetical protein